MYFQGYFQVKAIKKFQVGWEPWDFTGTFVYKQNKQNFGPNDHQNGQNMLFYGPILTIQSSTESLKFA